jgi:hypothetical protein
MSKEYEQHDEEIELPKGSGIPGILEAIRGVLALPRVTNIQIAAPAKITYTFFLRKGDKSPGVKVNFEDVMPYAIVRNGEVEEIPYPSANAAVACAEMFERSHRDHMYPVCFLGGQDSALWAWYQDSVGHPSPTEDDLFGLPFLTDRAMEDMALLLCTSFKKGGTITDTVKSYKVSIPQVNP